MAARLIEETDIIEVSNPPVLLYGEPGVGKTTLAQSGSKTLTLDFDSGLHRSAYRKAGLRFDSWNDLIAFQKDPAFARYDTIIPDTIGTLLEYMARAIIEGNTKMGTKVGGLSLQGWGVLKTTFSQWLAGLRAAGKQVVMIAHQKEERNGEERVLRPDIQGGSYGIVMNSADIVGYISYRNGARFISFDPCDTFFAKNGAGLKSCTVPHFEKDPHFLADLLTQARQNLGHTAEASAQAAKVVAEWQAWLDGDPLLDQLNAQLPEMGKLVNGVKAQVWKLVSDHATKCLLVFDKASKKFVKKEGAAA